MLTSLSKEALPIIRFRARDLTRILPPTAHSMRRLGLQLQNRIKQRLGITLQVAAGTPGSTPRSQGKAVRIIDNYPKA